MFNRTNLLIVLIAIAGAVGGFVAGGFLRPTPPLPSNPNALEIGDPAPLVERPDLAGAAQRLDQWRGRLVLVNFWASWCAPCREEMPLLDRTQQHLASRGFQVVGIAYDDPKAARTFLDRAPVHYPILIDDPARDDDLSAAFGNGSGVLPYSVLIGRDGRILARRAGSFTEKSLAGWLSPYL